MVIGDAGVGKTSLILRYVEGGFVESTEGVNVAAPVGTQQVDSKTKTLTVDGKKISLNIWDTAGQERWRTLTSSFYRGAQGVLLVFDVADQESFNNCKQWLDDIKLYTVEDIAILFVGNKNDKEAVVRESDINHFINTNYLSYMTCSALNNYNVKTVFEKLSSMILEKEN
uniref:Uncharacterized protein n=1 Tax=Arcella intermedia TaxID=1963864 RepID=A0A6B2LKU0_9EUKA